MAMTRRTTVILAGVLVGLLVFGVGVSLLTSPKGGKSITSVDDAVQRGIVGPSVAARMRSKGEVTALVHLQTDAVYAQLTNLLGKDQVQALIARMRQLYAANKDLILASVGSGAERIRDFEHIGLIEVRFTTEQALLAVAQSPLVERIGEVGSYALPNEDATGEPGNVPVDPSTYQGAGVALGVLDTGVDTTRGDGMTNHQYFDNDPIAMSVEKAPDDALADDGGHGSHVSSIIHAVAPAAKLYVADVFSRDPGNGDEVDKNGQKTGKYNNLASWPDIAAGVDWMIELRGTGIPIRAVNLSVGFGHFTDRCLDQVHFGDLIKIGIIPIVSAGNSAFEDNDGKATQAFQPGIGTPACVAGTLAVGLVSNGWNKVNGSCAKQADLGDHVVAYSQSSPAGAAANVALFAPGYCILGAGGYKSGTSMAAPHVTAAVADLVSAKDADAATITAALTGSGPEMTDPNSGIKRHRLDIQAAIDSLLSGSVPIATNPIGGGPIPGGGGTTPGSGSSGGEGGTIPVAPVVLVLGAAAVGAYWWYRRRKMPAG